MLRIKGLIFQLKISRLKRTAMLRSFRSWTIMWEASRRRSRC